MASVTHLSPGVLVREFDLTNFIPNVGVSSGAFVGEFHWGPAFSVTKIDNQNELVENFGKPTNANYVDWFAAYNFLAYTNNLNLVRVVDDTAKNSDALGTGILIKNNDQFQMISGVSGQTSVFAAIYPGNLGNSLKVSLADSGTFTGWTYEDLFDFAPGTSDFANNLNITDDEIHIVVVDEDGLFSGTPGTVLEKFQFLSVISDAKGLDGDQIFYGSVINNESQYVRYLGPPPDSEFIVNETVGSVTITTPGTGYVTVPTVTFSLPQIGADRATGTATINAGGVTGVVVTNPGSGYTTPPSITFGGPGSNAVGVPVMLDYGDDDWGQTALTNNGTARNFAALASDYTVSLSGGLDGGHPGADELSDGIDLFEDVEKTDANLLFVGAAGSVAGSAATSVTVIQHAIDNIAEGRKDCVVFYSPDFDDVSNETQSDATTKILAKKAAVGRSSSYAVMDSGWKLQFDQFNDKYRWIPLNPDIAGLCAQTDTNFDPWYSPAGFSRGKIKNVVSLAFNPNKTSRDSLYKTAINSVVTFNADGTVLYGDKTTLAKPSAFGYINVRRLFIVLEKSIAQAAKYQLFELNNQFTRAQFKNMVEPYLREVQGRHGIYDFFVQCDETNNTPEVIDRAEFVASIYIKPARSINFITLNFVAVRTGVEFTEVLGSF
jgi:hypothetical protein